MPLTDRGSYIYRAGTAPNTRAAVSQKNKVYGYGVGTKGFAQIGAISEFGTEESRDVEAIHGVGYGDQVAELVPNVTAPMTMTLNKTLLYAVNVFQTVGYKAGIDGIARSLRHHRWPFDIKQELVFSEIVSQSDVNGGPNVHAPTTVSSPGPQFIFSPDTPTPITPVQALFTFYEGCWFNSYSTSYTSDAALVAETAQCTVTDILDGFSNYGEFIDTGLAPVANNGQAGAGYSLRFVASSALATPFPPNP